jgi:glycosidase
MLKLVPASHPAHTPSRELHVSRESRDRYQFDQSLFSLRGQVIFADFHSARLVTQRMNERRDLGRFPERAVRASELYALGLIDEIMHHIVAEYKRQRRPDVMQRALERLEDALESSEVEQTLATFVENFPPIAVYQGDLSVEEYLDQETDGTSNREIALEELLMLWLANENPAAGSLQELFDDLSLETRTRYREMIDELRGFFKEQPSFGPEDQDLIEMLQSPSRSAPKSLRDQLEYIRTHWDSLLGPYMTRLLRSVDFIDEENRGFFGPGPGPIEAYEFGAQREEPENFSPDRDWMPDVVMIAKNVYVWLFQLSETYERRIETLDQIPDEELVQLHERGFTALWLIGLWERSDASKRIKQRMGNPEAVASAYSLKRYEIAQDLGGEPAFEDLKARAWRYGIRMASDMVPNHMGIDSDWMIQHPDWFLGLDYCPFPTYSFQGPDLCDDDRVGVYLEDHYYDRSDAAVVFKRLDHWTGDAKYIYHGNDGTMMPWNDTAQLNYLMSEVREAVIQQILDVARRSPIIRFDAAMTLTKRHFQRLWFPKPGTGGDIPSRAQFGMTRAEFDEAMPEEFWRQVVDRIAEEVPDTLLLAEAFWMMEGFFVRTLGMHRVYNSAFMNMMRDEKNDEYRQLMKNTLEFDPEIVRRFVNFMNNPDEKTAVEQFDKGDKYFGICTVMATMPGLPMFGHGQIEGYSEKYGMEYQRSYWDESPDPYLVDRHKREIFPLLRERKLFAGIENFYLYDFFTADGTVDENVFAYSNRLGDRRALILYHNRYAETQGWVRASVAYAVKGQDGEKNLVQKTLVEGMGLPTGAHQFVIFRDVISDREYIRNARTLDERGLYAELQAYQVHVFSDFRVVEDTAWHRYSEICDQLNGQGVPDIEEALKELYLEPVHEAYRDLISATMMERLVEQTVETPSEEIDPKVLEKVESRIQALLDVIQDTLPHVAERAQGNEAEIIRTTTEELKTILHLSAWLQAARAEAESSDARAMLDYLDRQWSPRNDAFWGPLIAWLFTHNLGNLIDAGENGPVSRSWYEAWLLGKLFRDTLSAMDVEDSEIEQAGQAVKMLLGVEEWGPLEVWHEEEPTVVLRKALQDQDVQIYLHVNRYQGVRWFHKESFESLLGWRLCIAAIELKAEPEEDPIPILTDLHGTIAALLDAEAQSEYRIDKLIETSKTGSSNG